MQRALFFLIVFATTALAQVDPRAGLPVLLKVLSYDTNFESRGAGTFVILIVSEPDKAGARAAILSSVKDLGVPDIKKRPLKFIAAD